MESFALLIVLFAALAIPLVMAKFRLTSTPTAVAEMVTGMVLGHSLLGWVSVGPSLSQLADLGVIVLMFLSGMEIDFSLLRPTRSHAKRIGPAGLALLAYTSVLVLGGGFSLALKALGWFDAPGFLTIVYATVALGVVIAALKEQELLAKPFGQTMLLIAALGEVVPLIALTVYASVNGTGGQSGWWLLAIFAVAIVLLLRFRKPYTVFVRIDKSTTQLDIRLAFFLIITLVTVAETVGAESILGAFLAGIVMKLLRPREETQDKLTSLGYGFFIPIFFITTGVRIDLPKLLADPQSLALIPLFLIGFFVAKSLLAVILRLLFKPMNALAGTFLITTTITLVVPAVAIGQELQVVTAAQAGALTLAAIITCVVAPIWFTHFYQAEAEPVVKTRVHFIGTNLLTVPIAQSLSPELYAVTMYTDDAAKYKTYNSEVNVKHLISFTQGALLEAGAFDADIVMVAYFDHDKNYALAQWALAAKVKRIIARFEGKNVQDPQYDKLLTQGVEVYNTLDGSIAMLRSLIESPSTMKILTDTSASIYELTVRNRRFTGLEIKNLPFIDDITITQLFRDDTFIAPHGDTQIHLGDHILFSGNKATVAAIRQALETAN